MSGGPAFIVGGLDVCGVQGTDLVQAIDFTNANQISHSTAGGEVARYVARAEPGRVANSRSGQVEALATAAGRDRS